jgi:hypothetical protein
LYYLQYLFDTLGYDGFFIAIASASAAAYVGSRLLPACRLSVWRGINRYADMQLFYLDRHWLLKNLSSMAQKLPY